MTVTEATSVSQVEQALKSNPLVFVNFWATWCEPCGQMNNVFKQLSEQHTNATFLQVEAEQAPEVAEKYEVKAVPYFIFVRNSNVVDYLEGANAPELVKRVNAYSAAQGLANKPSSTSTSTSSSSSSSPAPFASSSATDLNTRLKNLTNFAPVVVFMKGKPSEPKCGFSNKLVDILNKTRLFFLPLIS
eukprot:TRINITY_DN2617_c0_g1_i3.p1 TRINITY_DN2617_c0_g1~~TRINITY_DN2617_c0_g1_i3.p1  ORF type:complete len:198 (-),score=74.11 TRINITY_DN2617_c0_g1_i3:658-1221(-)